MAFHWQHFGTCEFHRMRPQRPTEVPKDHNLVAQSVKPWGPPVTTASAKPRRDEIHFNPKNVSSLQRKCPIPVLSYAQIQIRAIQPTPTGLWPVRIPGRIE